MFLLFLLYTYNSEVHGQLILLMLLLIVLLVILLIRIMMTVEVAGNVLQCAVRKEKQVIVRLFTSCHADQPAFQVEKLCLLFHKERYIACAHWPNMKNFFPWDGILQRLKGIQLLGARVCVSKSNNSILLKYPPVKNNLSSWSGDLSSAVDPSRRHAFL